MIVLHHVRWRSLQKLIILILLNILRFNKMLCILARKCNSSTMFINRKSIITLFCSKTSLNDHIFYNFLNVDEGSRPHKCDRQYTNLCMETSKYATSAQSDDINTSEPMIFSFVNEQMLKEIPNIQIIVMNTTFQSNEQCAQTHDVLDWTVEEHKILTE
jgi:hypothetical protein